MKDSDPPGAAGPARSRARRVLPAVAAGAAGGVIAALAFPPADAGALAFVALAPLAFVFLRPGRYSLAAASSAFAVTFFGMLVSWIRLFGPEAYAGLVVGESAFVVVTLVAAQRAVRGLPERWLAVALPVAFLAGEYLRSRLLFGGFGWGGFGYTQHDNLRLLHLAPYTGVWGVSLVVASTAVLAERAATHARRNPRRAIACVVGAGLLALAPGLLPVPAPQGRSARVAVVQGSAPEGTADPRADDLAVLRSHGELTRSLGGEHLALVVWPESAVEVDPRDPQVRAALAGSARAAGAPLLAGATLDEPNGRFRNSSLLIGPDGRTLRRYDKQHLVPFGEYVPFRRQLVPLVDELRRVPRDAIPGRVPVVFTLPEGRFSVAICFESTFPAIARKFVVRGARLLVVSTNDSSFGRTAAARQHLAFAQLRAAEHRMWVVQAALTGISAFVAPSGEVVQRTGLFEPATVTGDVRFAAARTLYGLLGDWLPAACVLLLAGLAVAAAAARRVTFGEAPTGRL